MDIDEETPGMVHPAFTMSDFHVVVMTTTSALNALSSINMDVLVDSDSEDTTGLQMWLLRLLQSSTPLIQRITNMPSLSQTPQ
jgi:hypothetical protein